jgi:hypothetical protein
VHKVSVGICAAIGVLRLLYGTAALADPGDAKAQVLAQEKKYTAGILRGDVRLLDSVWADSFVDTNGNAVMRDKAAMLALVAKSPPPRSIVESHRLISIYGLTAVVTVEFRVMGESAGKAYTSTGRATDVWVSQGGVWRCVAAHSSEVRE